MLSPAPTDQDVALSPEWLSMVLSRPGAPVKVTGVKVVETLKTMASKIRFEAECDGLAKPRTLCVKGFFDPEMARSAGVNSRSEARFYMEIAPKVDVPVPDCVYAGIDEETGHGIILMEDVVAQGGRFLTALEPYTPDQAHSSLEQLAKLHAAEWGRPAQAYPWMVSRLEGMAATPMLPLDLLQTMIEGERGNPLPAGIKSAERIQKSLQSLVAGDAGQPECLVHGDAHAGNLFVLNGQVSLIDWQVLQRAHWALDVAYHVGAALSVEDRQKNEQALLRHYLERLAGFGVEAPSWEEAWLQYRRHMVYGYFMWAITRRVDLPIILEFVRRLGLAVSQLESFELLGV